MYKSQRDGQLQIMLKFLTKESDSEHQLALEEREQQSDAAESNIFDFTEQREPNKFKKATIQSCIAKGSRRPEPTFCQLTDLPKRSGPAPFRKVSRVPLEPENIVLEESFLHSSSLKTPPAFPHHSPRGKAK